MPATYSNFCLLRFIEVALPLLSIELDYSSYQPRRVSGATQRVYSQNFVGVLLNDTGVDAPPKRLRSNRS